MIRCRSFLLAALFLAAGFTHSKGAVAQVCGEDEPGRAEWTLHEEDEGLYNAVFTGREGTVACFDLLTEQYDRREPTVLPAGVPAWFGAVGPLNMVSTWDTEYLPFSFSFINLDNGKTIKRTVKSPVGSASKDKWKIGETIEALPQEAYDNDPTYTLVSATEEEIVYVWPDPVVDESEVFVEKRYRKLGGYRIGLDITIYNFSQTDLATQPQVSLHQWEAEKQKRGMFSPPPNILEGMCQVGDGDLESESGSDLLEEAMNPPGEARWISVSNRYFITALISRGLSEARCTLSAQKNGVVSAAMYRSNPFTVSPAEDAMCYPVWYRPETQLVRCPDVAEMLELPAERLFLASEHEKAYASHKDSIPAERSAEIFSVLKNLSASRGAVLYSFELYLGPKDIDRLKEADVGLEDSIDFWIVGVISKPMLYLLRWFHSVIPNWAFAIMMLTVLVKLALLYWTQKSFSQMQRMSALKPMMDQLKEKYGKDKERLNQEMMSLYKREKVNPVGGCLPMLLQMPIWIALYRTIYGSVSLYQAPLGGWIQDLSAPDPYFVLPIILGMSMFGQQKLTPTTMDSAQARADSSSANLNDRIFILHFLSSPRIHSPSGSGYRSSQASSTA